MTSAPHTNANEECSPVEPRVDVRIEPLLLRREDASRVLSVSPRVFDNFVLAGLVHPIKIGGIVGYEPEDLRRFVRHTKARQYTATEIRELIKKNAPYRNK